LNGQDDLQDDSFIGRGAHQSKRGVEFIDRPVGFDTRIRFRHPDAVHQCRLARISGLGRDGHPINEKTPGTSAVAGNGWRLLLVFPGSGLF